MMKALKTRRLGFWFRLIRTIGVIVPRRLRADWRKEWEAELHYRQMQLSQWERLDWRCKLDLLRRSLGAFRDALWMQTYRWEDEMIQDLRFACRMLLKQSGFTFIALLTLGLGIGANTAIFSIVQTVLLNPLPYEKPDQLMMVWEANPELGKEHTAPSPANYLDIQEQIGGFASVTTWFETARTLQGEYDSEQVYSAQVGVEFFHTLGARAAHGRVFLPGEVTGVANDGPGQYLSGDRVVIISDKLWRRRFGADSEIVGKMITINALPWQVLGVMPAGFAMPESRTDLWMPWDIKQTYGVARFAEGPPRDWRFLKVLARLKPGVTKEQAQAHLDALSIALADQYPKTNRGWSLQLTTFYDEVVGAVRPPLLMLMAAVGLVLLIACANVAGLLLARSGARQREIAVRSALGASRLRLLRQMLTESLLLALAGGALGLGLSLVCKDLLISLAPPDVPRIAEVALDVPVLLFTLLVSLVTGIGFGLIPALKSTQTNLTTALKEGGDKGVISGLSQHRFLKTMTIAEIALAMVLLSGAGLLTRSFTHLLRADPGFEARNLLTMHITLDGVAYRGRAADYYRQLIERLESIPGVVSGAAVTTLPMSNVGVDFDRPYWREGEAEPGGEGDKVDIRMATPGYFRTMGITLLQGRAFTQSDRRDSPAVIIINESLAAKVWPNQDPIGKRLMIDYNRGKYAYEVIGITRGISYYGMRSRPQPELFMPHAQNAYLPMNVVLRTTIEPMQLLKAVKDEVQALDARQPAHNLVTMEQFIAQSLAADRFTMWLLGLLSVLALLLAAIGIYGVMSYVMNQRTQEFGVRLALGARPKDVVGLALKQGLKLTLPGVGLGVAGALAATHLMKNLLFGVSPTDPLTFVTLSLLLTLVALVACFIPARRAARLDPLVALRCE